jgi:hypothetical protein
MNVTSSSLVYDNDDGDNGSNCGMDVGDTNSGSTMTSSVSPFVCNNTILSSV